MPGEFQKSSDTPFVRDFVAHVGCDHTEVVIDSRELADDDLNRAVLQAIDFPLSISGDIRRCTGCSRRFGPKSTVALSGESADEVFGGTLRLLHPKAVDAATFPWLANTGSTFDGTQVLAADLLEELNLAEFQTATPRRLPRPRSKMARTPSSGGCERSIISI